MTGDPWSAPATSGVSPRTTLQLAPHKLGRVTGGFYLGFILASVLADALGHIGLGEAGDVYEVIASSARTFRMGLVIALISAFLFLMSAWGLYVLLRSVDQHLALLFLLLNAVGVAIQCASMLPLLSALFLGDGASHMQAYSAAQQEGLAYLSIDVYRTGFATAQLFYGTWLFPLGYLVYKSEFLPPVPGRTPGSRWSRCPDLVRSGPAAAGTSCDQLPGARCEFHS
jgi:hypothetical protein